MDIKAIKNEQDYAFALSEIGRLMNAEPGSVDENRLEVLAILVEKYEEEVFPIDLPDAVSAIKFRMEQEGLKQKDLVPYIGSQPKVSAVLNGKRELSKEMIRKLHEGLGIPLEVLINQSGSETSEPAFSLKRFPFFNQMVKHGYFSGISSTRVARKNAENLLEELFSVFEGRQVEQVFTRRTDCDVDLEALKAWQARVLHLVKDVEIEPFYDSYPQQYLINKLRYMSEVLEPDRIRQTLNEAGIHFVILRHLDRTYLDGAAFMSPKGNPIIALTLRHDRLDNFWFTLFHELGHVFLHLIKDPTQSFFDDTSKLEVSSEENIEVEANAFAQEALIPSKLWNEFTARKENKTESKLIEFSKKLGINPAIPAGRMRYENQDYKGYGKLVGAHCVRESFDEYDANPNEENGELRDEEH